VDKCGTSMKIFELPVFDVCYQTEIIFFRGNKLDKREFLESRKYENLRFFTRVIQVGDKNLYEMMKGGIKGVN
jgi:hypothetical protein